MHRSTVGVRICAGTLPYGPNCTKMEAISARIGTWCAIQIKTLAPPLTKSHSGEKSLISSPLEPLHSFFTCCSSCSSVKMLVKSVWKHQHGNVYKIEAYPVCRLLWLEERCISHLAVHFVPVCISRSEDALYGSGPNNAPGRSAGDRGCNSTADGTSDSEK